MNAITAAAPANSNSRSDLLDLAAIFLPVGKTQEVSGLRLHRFAESLRVTSLKNAGKRGERCIQWTFSAQGLDQAGLNLIAGFLLDGGEKAIGLAIDTARALSIEISHDTLRSVDVAPEGFADVTAVVDGRWALAIGWEEALIKDLSDPINEPRCLITGRLPAARLRAWLSKPANRITLMGCRTMHKVRETLQIATRDRWHQWCAMD